MYRYNLYGGVLWDLNNYHIDVVCVLRGCKCLRKAWELPADTHDRALLMLLLSNSLPHLFIDELAKRSNIVIQGCLSSDSYHVRFISYYRVLFPSLECIFCIAHDLE